MATAIMASRAAERRTDAHPRVTRLGARGRERARGRELGDLLRLQGVVELEDAFARLRCIVLLPRLQRLQGGRESLSVGACARSRASAHAVASRRARARAASVGRARRAACSARSPRGPWRAPGPGHSCTAPALSPRAPAPAPPAPGARAWRRSARWTLRRNAQ